MSNRLIVIGDDGVGHLCDEERAFTPTSARSLCRRPVEWVAAAREAMVTPIPDDADLCAHCFAGLFEEGAKA